jgi:hypothetical protein
VTCAGLVRHDHGDQWAGRTTDTNVRSGQAWAVTLEAELSEGGGLSIVGVRAGVAILRRQLPTCERRGRHGPGQRVARVASKGVRGLVVATANERVRSGLAGSSGRQELCGVRARRGVQSRPTRKIGEEVHWRLSCGPKGDAVVGDE